MSVRRSVGATLLLAGVLLPGHRVPGNDAPLALADLEAYRVALAAKPDDSAPTVGFRDLWERPSTYSGKAVSVEGRLARLFRQPGVGEFPPLAEAWVVTPSGDPFCLVFPLPEGRPSPEVGAQARFSGTFLKRVEYKGGDAPRLAPLIVGPLEPTTTFSGRDVEGMDWTTADWLMAAGASAVVGLVLARRHLTRPARVALPLDPPPSFVDGEPDGPGASP